MHVCFKGLWEEEFIYNPQKNFFLDEIKFYRQFIDVNYDIYKVNCDPFMNT